MLPFTPSPLSFYSLSSFSSREFMYIFSSQLRLFPAVSCTVTRRMSKAPAFPNDRITPYYYRPVEQNHVFRMITGKDYRNIRPS